MKQAKRLKDHGPNTLPETVVEHFFVIFIKQFRRIDYLQP